MWGSADYERIAERFAPVHDDLVERLLIRPGERLLDVATGTGEVAARAARQGADVTAIDIAPGMLAIAQQTHGDAAIQFDLGDVQSLPYDDAAFDIVASTFGAIFAPDHEAVARELTRVCRDRIGLTVWKPNPGLRDLYARFGLDSPEGSLPFRWGSDGYAQERLVGFDLVVEERTWMLDQPDGEAHWEFWSSSAPPFKAMVASLNGAKLDAFHEAYVAYCEQFREDGRVRVPREYLLILGRKR